MTHPSPAVVAEPAPPERRRVLEALRLPTDGLSRRAGSVARWLVALRWIALLVLVPIVATATSGDYVADSSIGPLWLGTGALLVFNAVATFSPRERLGSTPGLTLQVFFDASVLAFLVHHVGGMANPFAGLFVFHVVIAGIVLDHRPALRVAIGISALVATATLLEATRVLEPGCVRALDGICEPPDALHIAVSGIGILILVAGSATFVIALVGRLRREGAHLARAREAVGQEREKLSSVVECMADAVVFADPAGNIVLRNRAATALWPDGPPAREDLRVCHNAETWERLLGVLQDPAAMETHPLLEVGDRVYEATYGRVCDDADTLRGVVMVARDVTGRREEQEWRMKEERMSVVGKLAANLAHELNNPLGAISLYSQHALGKLDPGDPLHDHVETIRRNADLCKVTVRDLLDYARQRAPERRQVAVATLVGDAVRTLGPAAERAGVAMLVSTEVADAEVFGDPQQLGQVLVNLGLNAIEAMTTGGELRFGARRGGDLLWLEVRDTGPGIPEEDRERVFDAFYTTKTEGTGLGLAVVRDIVTVHGGTVELSWPAEGGAAFAFSVPTAASDAGEKSEEAAE